MTGYSGTDMFSATFMSIRSGSEGYEELPKKIPIDRCLIIGAGISGLVAGRKLQDQGIDITVIDKGRGVGGRASTRIINGARFDHGAQSFTADDPRFRELVEGFADLGAARVWYEGWPDEKDSEIKNRRVHYYGTNGMNHIPKSLAAGLDVITGEKVTEICFEKNLWKIVTSAGGNFKAPALIMTPPMPQTLQLLSQCEFKLDPDTNRQLSKISYDRCIAAMYIMDRQSKIPMPGGLVPDSSLVKWISDSYTKGITDEPCGVVAHSTAKFAQERWDSDDERIASILLAEIRDFLGYEPLGYRIHRWRYSQPNRTFPQRYFLFNGGSPLLFAGDGFGRGSCSIEAAALSGMEAAERLVEIHA